MRRTRYGWLLTIPLALAACAPPTDQAPSVGESGDVLGSLGTVHFPVECDSEAADAVQRGVALLHHMTYSAAQQEFEKAAAADPRCAMALWGRAMTLIHPLWQDRPTPEMLALGAELVEQAQATVGDSSRERAYVETVGAYFDDGASLSEAERLVRYEAAWRRVHEENPEDLEAKAFYALAHLALADPDDKSYEIQRAAGSMAEEVLAAAPDHPGAHHYIIHSYDYPPLAELALPVARNYGKIAPDVPHALHMTSHIFTRRGLWDESIEWNVRSAAAALELSDALGAVSMHYQHALDYLTYAYLQKAMDEQAREIVEKTAALEPPFHEVNRPAAAHAFAAIPARYAVERQDWAAAAALEPRVPSVFPWEEAHLQFVAMTHFARALGLAHSERLEDAQAEVARLVEIEQSVGSPYWAKQVRIQRMGAESWISYLGGATDVALAKMREAASVEATTEKAPVTPGEVLPAAELLGDMLLAQEQYREAIEAYETALARSPNRFNSLYGAGRAAELAGDPAAAGEYYRQLVSMTDGASEQRERLAHAREFTTR